MGIFLSTSRLSHTEEGVQEPDNLLLQPRPQGLLGILKNGARSRRGEPGKQQVSCLQNYWRF